MVWLTMIASWTVNRINWIDWAKFLAIALVVPIHIPQEPGAQPVTYFEVFIIQAFFFYSGYLKKPSSDLKMNFLKYWQGLIIPYFIYNILFYPYWFTKFYLTNLHMPNMIEALKPMVGILLLQTETSISCGLNSVTYFLAVLLIMHLIFDLCYRTKYVHYLMIAISLIAIALYTLSKYNFFTRELVFVGLFKSFSFYYLGYICKRYNIFKKLEFKKDLMIFVCSLLLSILSFQYHANETNFSLHMISFWPTVLLGILAFTSFCKLLDNIHSQAVVNYSNGTMAFIGLHWMIVGISRYAILKPIFHVPADYVYSSVEAYLFALVVTLVLYPIILFFLKKAPWMLGKRTNPATET